MKFSYYKIHNVRWGYLSGYTYLSIRNYKDLYQRQIYMKLVFSPKSTFGPRPRQTLISECDNWWLCRRCCRWNRWYCIWYPPSTFTVYLNKMEKMIEIWDGSCSCHPVMKLPYKVLVTLFYTHITYNTCYMKTRCVCCISFLKLRQVIPPKIEVPKNIRNAEVKVRK